MRESNSVVWSVLSLWYFVMGATGNNPASEQHTGPEPRLTPETKSSAALCCFQLQGSKFYAQNHSCVEMWIYAQKRTGRICSRMFISGWRDSRWILISFLFLICVFFFQHRSAVLFPARYMLKYGRVKEHHAATCSEAVQTKAHVHRHADKERAMWQSLSHWGIWGRSWGSSLYCSCSSSAILKLLWNFKVTETIKRV